MYMWGGSNLLKSDDVKSLEALNVWITEQNEG